MQAHERMNRAGGNTQKTTTHKKKAPFRDAFHLVSTENAHGVGILQSPKGSNGVRRTEKQQRRDGTAATRPFCSLKPCACRLAAQPKPRGGIAPNDLRLKCGNSKASACFPSTFVAAVSVRDDLHKERSCAPYQQK